MSSFERRAGRLQIACLAFAVLGLAIAFLADSSLFALYTSAMARVYPFGDAERDLWRWMAGPLGATIAGKWFLAWALARWGIARRRRWAHDASIAGLVSWFVVDSAASIARGAWFNVWMINLVPLVVVGIALALTRRGLHEEPVPPTRSRWQLVLDVACAATILVGLAVAVSPSLLPPYQAEIEARFGDFDPGFERFLFGPLGGTVVGQAVLLLALSRRPIRAGEGWALRAALQSLLLWFVVDSVVSLANRAAFNVWMVNLPSLLALGIPLVVLRYRSNWSVAAQR